MRIEQEQDRLEQTRVQSVTPFSKGVERVLYDEIDIYSTASMPVREKHDSGQRKIFQEQNPHLKEWAFDNASKINRTGRGGLDYRMGAQLTYSVVRKEANEKGGVPPLITPGIIERYKRDFYGDDLFEQIELYMRQNNHEKVKELVDPINPMIRQGYRDELRLIERDFMSMVRMTSRRLKLTESWFTFGAMDILVPFRIQKELSTFERMWGED